MKKLFSLIALFAFVAITFGQSTSPRFGTSANEDNTGRVLTYLWKTPAVYSGTVTVGYNGYNATVKPAAFSSSVTPTVIANVASAFAGDQLTFIFSGGTYASGGSAIVTFATNFLSTGTVAIAASKTSVVRFIFNGAKWVEVARAVNQ